MTVRNTASDAMIAPVFVGSSTGIGKIGATAPARLARTEKGLGQIRAADEEKTEKRGCHANLPEHVRTRLAHPVTV